MNKKNLLSLIIIFTFCFLLFTQVVKASPSDNVFGYAWSGNIGWIKFNGENYGVNIKDNGDFEGYAWSSNIGWIDFAPSGGYPISPNYSARVDLTTGEVDGWARAYRPISSEGQTLGDWTGWISLRGNNYGVEINTSTGDFSNFAWGGGGLTNQSAVIGWIRFDGVKVNPDIFNPVPNTPDLMSETWNDCSFKGVSIPTFNWNYSHPENKDQAGYEIEINGVETLRTSSTIPSTSYTPPLDWIENNLLFGENPYSWRVRVKDIDDNWSNWSNLKSFETRKHAYPFADFEWWPIKPIVDQDVQFTDLSESFGGATIVSWQWQFPGTYQCVNPETGCQNSSNPLIKFLSAIKSPDNRVVLTIIDSSNFSCPGESKEINISLPLPQWKEVPPIIWLRNIFADVTGFLAKLKI